MKTKRFNNLAILTTHKDLVDDKDYISIGNEFASKHERRKYLGEFISTDLK